MKYKGVRHETSRIFKGKGFWKNTFVNNKTRDEAIQCLDERIRELEKWEVVGRSTTMDRVLMVDKVRNVKTVFVICNYGSFMSGGPTLEEFTMDSNSLREVHIEMNPAHMSGSVSAHEVNLFSGTYHLTIDIWIKFISEKDSLSYYPVQEKKAPITIEHLTRTIMKVEPQLKRIREIFGKKITSDQTLGPRLLL